MTARPCRAPLAGFSRAGKSRARPTTGTALAPLPPAPWPLPFDGDAPQRAPSSRGSPSAAPGAQPPGRGPDVSPGTWTCVVEPRARQDEPVFDVILREGERRYLGAASPKARQFFGKLGRADVERIEGLPVPMAVARRSVTSNPRSTVGTQSGVLDLLRLLFAREADGGDVDLTRSHFSFNTALGACPACGGLGEEDAVDPALLIADENRSIREGALVPTLKSGYTVYSQVTLEVMDTICRAHGFDVDTPWRELTDEQRHVILFGTKKLVVPFGKHSLESRMKWEGITARPREEGHYRGIVPVIEETLKRGRNPNIMRFVRSTPCESAAVPPVRAGAEREAPVGRDAARALRARGDRARGARGRARGAGGRGHRALAAPILERMVRLGLGHLSQSRAANTLSGGEAQRLRLAAHLTSGLSGALYALDGRPSVCIPSPAPACATCWTSWWPRGHAMVVEHDPGMVGFADRAVSLGPGAGPLGGRIMGDTEDRGAPRRRRRAHASPQHRPADPDHGRDSSQPRGRRRRDRAGRAQRRVGPSGAASRPCLRHPAPGADGPGRRPLRGARGRRGRRGARGRRAPHGTLLAQHARDVVGALRSRAQTLRGDRRGPRAGLGRVALLLQREEGRALRGVRGLGRVKVGLHLFEDATSPARAAAAGSDDALEVRVGGANVAEVLAMDVDAACSARGRPRDPAAPLGAPGPRPRLPELGATSTTLSSGEAQRIRLATIIAAPPKRALFLFDEPDRGLHPADLARLVDALDVLCAAGHTVLCVSHHQLLWRAADVLHEVREGRTRRASLDEVDVDFAGARRAARPAPPETIELRGVRTHNLDGVDVSIPRGAMTAIVGPSGSGKSSLAFDTIAAEAWRRYAECLPFQVRRFMERAPRPLLDRATGLTPVVALSQSGGEASGSSTVATLLGVAPLLRLLWARAGDGPEVSAGDLRADGGPASRPACAGRGRTRRCSAEAS